MLDAWATTTTPTAEVPGSVAVGLLPIARALSQSSQGKGHYERNTGIDDPGVSEDRSQP